MRDKLNNFAKGPVAGRWPLGLIAFSVFATGLLTITSVLFAQLRHHSTPIVSADAHVTLLVGLTFVYLASLLKRGKRNAWLIALPLYGYIVVRNIRHFIFDLPNGPNRPLPIFLNLLVPVVALAGLVLYRHLFTVRSEIRNFTVALRWAAVILVVAFLYGLIGFQLLDERDFHQEIPLLTGAHYTVDQFGLTTSKQLTPYTKRARVFLDSLAVISLGSVFYVGVSFFSPIRQRFGGQGRDLEQMVKLLQKYPASSEDFFKLWPRDKAYFFDSGHMAGLAYKTVGGSALCVGDPAGARNHFAQLIKEFLVYCHANDWEPAFIHTEPKNSQLFRRLGFEVQKIGEEAIVDVVNFNQKVVRNKYFRHIANKFGKQKYSCELLEPPHSNEVIQAVKKISDDWLKVPGRAERGMMLGYFTSGYIQKCKIMVVRNGSGKIQAFINQVPSFNRSQANFDLLRHARGSQGNINDFLMLNFIKQLQEEGYKTLNMGLCPLSGLDTQDVENSAINSILSFAYANGNRFYSFKGLKRFKEKYQPSWEGRYIVYTGGLRGFTRTLNALLRAMRVGRVHLR